VASVVGLSALIALQRAATFLLLMRRDRPKQEKRLEKHVG
jgi:hypothetical protein